MAGRIIWAPAALQDLQEIRRFISRDSNENARRFLRKLREAPVPPLNYPMLGHIVPEFMNPDWREVMRA